MGKSNRSKKKLFGSFKEISIDKDIKAAHWVGHSKLKELYINDLFYRKQMIEDLEAGLTGALKEISNTENLAVAEEENVDESITAEAKASNDMENHLKDERKKIYYEEKMNIDDEKSTQLKREKNCI